MGNSTFFIDGGALTLSAIRSKIGGGFRQNGQSRESTAETGVQIGYMRYIHLVLRQ